MEDDDKETYLGDGVYASFNGWHICLRAPRENEDYFVYLDPEIFHELLQYAKRIRQKNQKEQEAQEALDHPKNG